MESISQAGYYISDLHYGINQDGSCTKNPEFIRGINISPQQGSENYLVSIQNLDILRNLIVSDDFNQQCTMVWTARSDSVIQMLPAAPCTIEYLTLAVENNLLVAIECKKTAFPPVLQYVKSDAPLSADLAIALETARPAHLRRHDRGTGGTGSARAF